jgi:hypothetical protein
MTTLTIPSVGTNIPFAEGDAVLSRDERTWICRVHCDDVYHQWEVVSPDARRGLLVFLNDAPDEQTTHIRISAIQSSGRAAYGDPVALSLNTLGYYD